MAKILSFYKRQESIDSEITNIDQIFGNKEKKAKKIFFYY
jgi:hypothetical protein